MSTLNSNTPALRFPDFDDNWKPHQLRNVTDYVDYRGKTPAKNDDGIFLVTAKNIKQGYIDYECSKEYIDSEEYDEVMRRGKPEIGDVLITTEAPLGNVASIDRVDIALAQRVIKLRGKKDLLNNSFLKQKLISPQFQKILDEKASGTTAKGIKGSELHKIVLSFPSLPEQQKIAAFLTAIDQKLHALKKKHTLLQQYKKGIMQQLFSQQLRFKDDNGNDFPEWEEKSLGELSQQIKRTGDSNEIENYEVLTISAGTGFIDQKERFNQVIAGDSLLKYTLLKKNEFSYNRGASKRFPFGCIYSLTKYDYALVPNVYISFRLHGSLNPDFFNHLFSTGHANRQLRQFISSSVRLDGLLNINKEDFFTITVPVPSLAEQTKIAGFLTAIDNKISHAQAQVQHVEQYKKALLQAMFV